MHSSFIKTFRYVLAYQDSSFYSALSSQNTRSDDRMVFTSLRVFWLDEHVLEINFQQPKRIEKFL